MRGFVTNSLTFQCVRCSGAEKHAARLPSKFPADSPGSFAKKPAECFAANPCAKNRHQCSDGHKRGDRTGIRNPKNHTTANRIPRTSTVLAVRHTGRVSFAGAFRHTLFQQHSNGRRTTLIKSSRPAICFPEARDSPFCYRLCFVIFSPCFSFP